MVLSIGLLLSSGCCVVVFSDMAVLLLIFHGKKTRNFLKLQFFLKIFLGAIDFL